jgi:hypothetical protein
VVIFGDEAVGDIAATTGIIRKSYRVAVCARKSRKISCDDLPPLIRGAEEVTRDAGNMQIKVADCR